MKVKDLMTPNAKACTPTSTLAEAAGAMWDGDCGVLPVVTDGGKVVGLITDRDICMAAALNNRNLSNIAIEDVISGNVFVCGPEEDIHNALQTMQEHKVRRLPVVAEDGTLEGMLSLNDIILKAEPANNKRTPELSYGDVVKTYKAVSEHRLPTVRATAAAGV
jgi:CBS domain-containing protein